MGSQTSSPRIHNKTDEILKIVCTDKDGRDTSQIVRKANSWQPTIPSGKMTISVFRFHLANGVPVTDKGDAVLSTAESCYDFTIQKIHGMLKITKDYIRPAGYGQYFPCIHNTTNQTLKIVCTDNDGRNTSQIVTSLDTWQPSVQSGTLTVTASCIQSKDHDEGNTCEAVYTAKSWDNFSVQLVEGNLNINLQ